MAPPLLLGEGNEFLIDPLVRGVLGEKSIPEAEFDAGEGLEFLQHIEAPAAARALEAVAGVGDRLELVEHEARDDDGGFEDAGAGDVRDAAIDDDAGVEDDGARPLGGALKFDVGDDETEIVFGLQDEGGGQVGDHQPQQDLDAAKDGVGAVAGIIDIGWVEEEDGGDLVKKIAQADGDEDADEDAEEEPGEGGEVFLFVEQVDGDDGEGDHDDAGDDEIGGNVEGGRLGRFQRSAGGGGAEDLDLGGAGGVQGRVDKDGSDDGDQEEENHPDNMNHRNTLRGIMK
jgi:hypothetical protein